MSVTLQDILITADTTYGEGRGETFEGMKAIVHTIINRWRLRIGDADHSLAATALRHRQFSAWNEDDPNRPKMQAATVANPLYRKCLHAVLEAVDEADFTKGARHYMTKARRAQGWPKGWGPEREPCYVAGVHLFYNNVA